MTNKAIYTVLRFLGMAHMDAYRIMDKFSYYDSIDKFEEVRHHELRLIFNRVYIQRKYFT